MASNPQELTALRKRIEKLDARDLQTVEAYRLDVDLAMTFGIYRPSGDVRVHDFGRVFEDGRLAFKAPRYVASIDAAIGLAGEIGLSPEVAIRGAMDRARTTPSRLGGSEGRCGLALSIIAYVLNAASSSARG